MKDGRDTLSLYFEAASLIIRKGLFIYGLLKQRKRRKKHRKQ